MKREIERKEEEKSYRRDDGHYQQGADEGRNPDIPGHAIRPLREPRQNEYAREKNVGREVPEVGNVERTEEEGEEGAEASAAEEEGV